MGLGSVSQGLYFWTSFPQNFDLSSVSLNKHSLCNTTINDNIFLSHQLLGHSASFRYHHCKKCPLAKQSCKPFPHSKSSVNKNFAIIHFDVWDHIILHIVMDYGFFFTSGDDYSRATFSLCNQKAKSLLVLKVSSP